MDGGIELKEGFFRIRFNCEHYQQELELMKQHVPMLSLVNATFPALCTAYEMAIQRMSAVAKALGNFTQSSELGPYLIERAKFMRVRNLAKQEFEYAKSLVEMHKSAGAGGDEGFYGGGGGGGGGSEIPFRPSTGVT